MKNKILKIYKNKMKYKILKNKSLLRNYHNKILKFYKICALNIIYLSMIKILLIFKIFKNIYKIQINFNQS